MDTPTVLTKIPAVAFLPLSKSKLFFEKKSTYLRRKAVRDAKRELDLAIENIVIVEYSKFGSIN